MVTLTRASSSTTAAQIVDQNALRKGMVIANDDANRCYVLLGLGTASATNYSFSLAQNENAALPNCALRVSAVWSTAGSGGLNVTEY